MQIKNSVSDLMDLDEFKAYESQEYYYLAEKIIGGGSFGTVYKG